MLFSCWKPAPGCNLSLPPSESSISEQQARAASAHSRFLCLAQSSLPRTSGTNKTNASKSPRGRRSWRHDLSPTDTEIPEIIQKLSGGRNSI